MVSIMENQMEKKMENEMETGFIIGDYRDSGFPKSRYLPGGHRYCVCT